MRTTWLLALTLVLSGCPHDWELALRHDGAVDVSGDSTSDAFDAMPDARDVAVIDARDADLDVSDGTDLRDVTDVRRVDVPVDTCTATCAGSCVNVATDPSNCGHCGMTCPGITRGRPACTAGVCSVQCDGGLAPFLGACVATTPRQISPISGAVTVSDHPTLRWVPGSFASPGGDVTVNVCADRLCASHEASIVVTDATFLRLPASLPRGAHFWGVEVTTDGQHGPPTPMWEFFVGGTAPGEGIMGFVPDVNGDGLVDALVSNPDATGGGSAYLFLGSTTGFDTGTSITPAMPAAGSPFGIALAALGDVDGDGFGDFAISQSCPSPTPCPGTARNTVAVYRGQSASPGFHAVPATISGTSGTQFGRVVAAGGDLNGDGYGDLAVGDPTYGSANQGRVSIYLGASSGTFTFPLANIDPPGSGGLFGAAISGGGDSDGDGLPELLIGSPGDAVTFANAGAAFLYEYSATLSPPYTHVVVSRGAAADARFGSAVAFIGDENADGLVDLVVGSPGENGMGVARLYAGQPAMTGGSHLLAAHGIGTAGTFGAVISAAGDFNGDGRGDVIIGDPTGSRAVILRYDSAAGTLTPYQSTMAPTGMTGVVAVGMAGYVDNDALADVIIGFNGGALILRGSLDMSGTAVPLVRPTGTAAFGGAVAQRGRSARTAAILLALGVR